MNVAGTHSKKARPVHTGLLRRFRRDQSGATAVEFGFIAIPFFALIFAILQFGLLFFANQTLETTVAMTARLIRTGQAQQQKWDATTFKAKLCDLSSSMFDCAKLKIDVRTIATFDSYAQAKPVDASGNLTDANFTYAPGKGGDIVIVRAFYEWPVFVSLLNLSYANTGNGNYLMSATAAFKNEPFPW